MVSDKLNEIEKVDSKSSIETSELLVSIIEQGLVSFLEYIIQGTNIISYKDSQQKNLKFPEQSIQIVCLKLLNLIIDKLCNNYNHLQILYQISNSMVYSGNFKLRMNILSSLLLLIGRSKITLGRLLCDISSLMNQQQDNIAVTMTSNNSNNNNIDKNNIFYDLLAITIRDRSQFKQIQQIIQVIIERILC